MVVLVHFQYLNSTKWSKTPQSTSLELLEGKSEVPLKKSIILALLCSPTHCSVLILQDWIAYDILAAILTSN